jgi:hypothetical protein
LWTDYPPPPDFDGEEEGEYDDAGYKRTLSSAEQAAIDATEASYRAHDRARAEAQRDAYFSIEPPADSEPGASAA